MKLRYALIILLAVASVRAQREMYVEELQTTETGFPILRGIVHPQKNLLVLSSQAKFLRSFSLTTQQEEGMLSGLDALPLACDITPDGKFAVVGDAEGNIIVWDVERKTQVRNYSHQSSPIVGLAVRKHQVMTVSADGEVVASNFLTGKELNSFSLDVEASCFALHGEERIAAFGTLAGEVVVYDANRAAKLQLLPGVKVRPTVLTFSPDNQYLIGGFVDGGIAVWETKSWALQGTIQNHRSGIVGLACDPKSRWVASVALDSTLRIFNISDRAQLKLIPSKDPFAFVSFSGEEQLVSGTSKGLLKTWRVLPAPPDVTSPIIVMLRPTPTVDRSPLKFFGSEYEFEGIACDDSLVTEVRVNGKPVPLQELAKYDSLRLPPGMKAKSFSTVVRLDTQEITTVTLKAVDWLGNMTSEYILLKRVPRDQAIEILAPSADAEVEKAYVRVQFKNWFDISSYSISVNLVNIVEPRSVRGKRIGDVITEEIPLIAGYNQIQITATARTGERLLTTFGVHRKAAPPVAQGMTPVVRDAGPQKWAVVVGVSEYAHPGIPSLKYADADAKAFADFLRTPEGGGFDNDHLRVLVNKEATIAAVQDALSNFLAQAIDIDLVVIYFAGHGAPEPARPSNLYLLMHDSDPQILRTTAFPMWQIQDVLARYITAKRIVVFSDACHSGGISVEYGTRGMDVTKNNPINQYLTDLARSKEGVVVFTASAAGEISQEFPELGHGAFTYYLLEGMKGAADFNNDYTITINETMQYVEEQVKRKTRGAQNPTRSQTSYDKNLTIAIRPH